MRIRPFPRTLWHVGWQYMRRHAWQTVLMGIGIALGVAVVVAIDLANASAGRAFELSTESVTGKATHQITGGPQGLDESVYTDLRRSGAIEQAAPVISATVTSLQLGNTPLQLLGIDPFAEAPFRSYLGGEQAPSVDQLTDFLTKPGAVLVSQDLAQTYGLQLGTQLTLDIEGKERPVFIAGLLQTEDALSRRTLSGLILADIATAQELTGREGQLDRIDLILPEGDTAAIEALTKRLPDGVELSTVAARTGTVEQLTSAFQVNLTALSLLALLVGVFLIYNTMTFSVVQRRELFGTLRALGVTRGEVFSLVLSEAFFVGILASIVGVGLGLLMGQTTTRMVLQTINDLYFTTTIQDVGIPVSSLIKGGLLGVIAAVLTAIPPAWEAASVPPRAALLRSGLETKVRSALKWISLAGLAVIGAGVGVFAIPTQNLVAGFSGTLAVMVGFALLTAGSMYYLMRVLAPVFGKIFGLLGRMAPRALINALSRTAVAVAALMVAVSVTVAVGLMIDSFRYTVVAWLSQTLQADVYISAPAFIAAQSDTAIDPEVVQKVSQMQGFAGMNSLRVTDVDSPRGKIQVSATDNAATGNERYYKVRDGTPDEVWAAMQNGAVIVSEPLANRLGLPDRGGSVELMTPAGVRPFPVAGIYYDYASSQGTVVMTLDVYRSIWNDQAITAIGLRLQEDQDPDQITQNLHNELSSIQSLRIRPNKALREEVMQVFDRTFAITGALQILATTVAFMGILNALLLLQLEKQREVGILRSIGLTVRQLWRLVMLETGLMGLAAGVLAMPAGYALALILIYVINRRSFGWTLQLDLTAAPFMQALLIAVAAALLAGIYPAYKLGKMAAAEAVRYE